jgi:hypothetical protein
VTATGRSRDDGLLLRRCREFPAHTARYARLNEPSHIEGLPQWAVSRRTGLMPLDPGMLNCAVRISSHDDLRGTGSIISVPSEAIPGRSWPYLITADHVVKNHEVEVEVPDPRTLGDLFPPMRVERWRQPIPNVDLAIARLPPVPAWQASRLEVDVLIPGNMPPLGAPLHYLGIFERLNRPMARTGAIGSPRIPIPKKNYAYEGYLVDCRSYNGFSGSPCFVTQSLVLMDEPLERMPEVPLRPDGSEPDLRALGFYAMVAGIFTAHYSDEDNEDENPDGLVGRYGVGIMIGTDYVWEALMAHEAIGERGEWDEEHMAAQEAAGPPLRDVDAKPRNEEYERFQELTKKLVNTPKAKRGSGRDGREAAQ